MYFFVSPKNPSKMNGSRENDSIIVNQRIVQLIRDIMRKYNLKATSQIKYHPGSEAGEGYIAQHVVVDIEDDETSLNLFLKFPIDLPWLHVLYANEINFYKSVYPNYREFCEQKNVQDFFRNVPASYGFDESKGAQIIALENLRKKGFTLFDRFVYMNEKHLNLILRTFARFHAVSFVMKDQRKALHDEFCEMCRNAFGEQEILTRMFTSVVEDFVKKLDSTEDSDILAKCDGLVARVYNHFKNLNDIVTDYSILAKGDCWINNAMILYENDDRERPVDVMLIDWQFAMRASPIHDIAPLFYMVASTETIDNYKCYMQTYHEELSTKIKELGSDPEVLYPFTVFEKEWLYYFPYVFGFSLVALKVMLCERASAPALSKDLNERDVVNMFASLTDNEEKYLRRAKYIARHFINIGGL